MVDLGTKSPLEYGIPDITTGLLSSIVGPPVIAQNFELKPQFIQFISNDSFADTPHECPISHIDSILEKCDTMKLNCVTDDAIRLCLFPFSLRDRVKEWLRDEGTGSFDTWDKLVKAFLVKFLGKEKTARLRNELSTFGQSDDESLYEAWRRFKRLQRQCPHHGILEWMLIQTFYNGLTHEFRIYIDAASGGSLLTKNPTKAKELIEKMAANDNYHSGGQRNVKKGGMHNVDAITLLTSSMQALTSKFDKFQATSSSSSSKTCQMCNNTQAQQNPTPPPPRNNNYNAPSDFQARPPLVQQPMQPPPQKSNLELMLENFVTTTNNNIQQLQAQNNLMENQISQLAHQVGQSLKTPCAFSGQIEKPPKGHMNAMNLRSGKKMEDPPTREPSKEVVDEVVPKEKVVDGTATEEEPKESTPPPLIPYVSQVPFSQKLAQAKLEKMYGKFLNILKKLHINIPFLDAISEMPSYAKFLKDMLSNKKNL
ncbi:uncharacterized protein LOC110690159 [Chenopodium quinoa]|uniref:uncharacterized protein LOC110690159 n=1 Tax=Chenopodium quinoa TaxID=63459 RepID=UPI000B77FCCB|nr:uncharacterized protein LOC110690159 [Chenopodium quinoa]